MNTQHDKIVADLVGKTMWGYHRAADMATFQFGARHERKGYFGKTAEIGEYALHVQCDWCITQRGRILVDSADVYCPSNSEKTGTKSPDNFDWDREPNLRDRRMALLFRNPTNLVVKKAELGHAGKLCIWFSQHRVLRVCPDNSRSVEAWRLFRPGKKDSHLVMSSGIAHS